MTLISVTITILKPISPDVGRQIRFTQNTRGIPMAPAVALPMLVASADMPARHACQAGRPGARGGQDRRVRLVFSLLSRSPQLQSRSLEEDSQRCSGD